LPHGFSWKIHDPKQFVTIVMPMYFEKQSKFTSFNRQVNGWGFRRVMDGPDRDAYYNQFFIRDQPHLMRMMKRTSHKNQVPTSRSSDMPFKVPDRHETNSLQNCSIFNESSSPDSSRNLISLPPMQNQLYHGAGNEAMNNMATPWNQEARNGYLAQNVHIMAHSTCTGSGRLEYPENYNTLYKCYEPQYVHSSHYVPLGSMGLPYCVPTDRYHPDSGKEIESTISPLSSNTNVKLWSFAQRTAGFHDHGSTTITRSTSNLCNNGYLFDPSCHELINQRKSREQTVPEKGDRGDSSNYDDDDFKKYIDDMMNW
jgi:hypothetical protein